MSKDLQEVLKIVSQDFLYPNGTFKSRSPPINSEKQHSKKYYLEKTKRLKHKADAMTSNAGNAFLYPAEAALLFTNYGIALKLDALEPKLVYSIFSNTIDLTKFIRTMKPFADSSIFTWKNLLPCYEYAVSPFCKWTCLVTLFQTHE